MKTLPVFSAFCLLTGLCMAQTTPAPTAIQPDGKVTVHIQYAPPAVPAAVTMEIYHVFPSSDYSVVRDSLSPGKRQIWLECPVRAIGRASLSIGDSSLTVLAVPGDTIHLSIQSDESLGKAGKPTFAFSGKTRALQEYYQAKEARLPGLEDKIWMQGMNAPDLDLFQQSAEKARQEEVLFLEQYKNQHPLPGWFVAFEASSLDYFYNWVKLYVANYYIDFKKTQTAAPEGYYKFLDRVKIQNEVALHNYQYLRFLREYLFWHLKSTRQSPADYLAYAKEIFGPKVGDFFEIWELSGSADNPEVTGSWSERTFPRKYQYLVDYVQARAQKSLQLLRPGEKAPSFALTDANDSLVTLGQFKGQVVYLSFWFTSCGACIKEFPYENKLAEQFGNQSFKVISICVGTPGAADEVQVDKWKEASQRFGLKTLDLYANKAWAKTLQEKYTVSSFPHYVLIGADGNLIQNFAPRPSNGAADVVGKALADMR